ncbi:hypothetical protein TpMuguga_01g00350 [Theileria parva strain Muguga]|uniref:Uncharacterized protein n=1 Tax=Theileria parva TaxID=5875 RepID=Q4N8W4_THEPA|nr:uncharacterized protein TpMuguga_01g00350 [Theileria parva strain Muguga]EAN33594.1 hypothetical protein TpMuguga_01g00350 [Theileria parva strain Muguga]|eukprot:XP_765877.1 hypothetical protein [Theileria parva strain Muguga]
MFLFVFLILNFTHCTNNNSLNTNNTKRRVNETIDVSGYVKISDKLYRATCNCPSHIKSLQDMIYRTNTLCRPSKIKVRTHNCDQVDKEIIDNFMYIPPNDFVYISEHHLSPMDSRNSSKSFFCPGGDLGMFMGVLMNIFKYNNNNNLLSESVVTDILKDYLMTLSENVNFYYNIDETALNNMKSALNWDMIDLYNINFNYHDIVKKLLIENISDQYIKYLYELYDNKQIIIWSIYSFFNLLWDKSSEKLRINTYPAGPQNPSVFIKVDVNFGCEMAEVFPLLDAPLKDKPLLIYSELPMIVKRNNLVKQIRDKFNLGIDDINLIYNNLYNVNFSLLNNFRKSPAPITF